MKEQDMCGEPITQAAEAIISAPIVLPYEEKRFDECKACGSEITILDRISAAVHGSTARVTNIRFCPGGKPPTENRPMMEAIMTGEAERMNPCAGVYGPHLHCSCRRCGYAYLVATASDRL